MTTKENRQAELESYAREAAQRSDDLYSLLGIDATTSAEDIHRAWRRRNLALHPDKAGASFDPKKLEAVTKARDVLLDEAARKIYDGGMRAALLRRQQYEASQGQRRAMIDDLERRERAEVEGRKVREEERREEEREKNRLAEAGRRRMEERARLVREAEERERQAAKEAGGADAVMVEAVRAPANGGDLDDRIAKLEQRLKDKDARKAEKAARKAEKRAKRDGMSAMDASREESATPLARKATTSPSRQPEPTVESLEGRPLRAVIAATVTRLRARQAEIDRESQVNAIQSTTDRLRAQQAVPPGME
jgi:DnaJ homolog subfamily C member 17